jgi:hypothetical protein
MVDEKSAFRQLIHLGRLAGGLLQQPRPGNGGAGVVCAGQPLVRASAPPVSRGIGFFTEQFNQHTPGRFYRSRVLQVLADPLRIENYKLRIKQLGQVPLRIRSAWRSSHSPTSSICPAAVFWWRKRPGCYHGEMLPGGECRLNPGDSTYIHIEFDLTAQRIHHLGSRL